MDNKSSMLESVEGYLRSFRKIGNREKEILEAIKETDRKEFMPDDLKAGAYTDSAMPIGAGQTISQPSTVARMLQLLELNKGDKVLEIGTGSGWNAALIGRIAGKKGKVISTEIFEELGKKAEERIKKLGMQNVRVISADFRKIQEKEKFDKIIFTAGISSEQEKILEQTAEKNLAETGILVCPFQSGPLIILKKEKGKVLKTYTSEQYVFVPLLG